MVYEDILKKKKKKTEITRQYSQIIPASVVCKRIIMKFGNKQYTKRVVEFKVIHTTIIYHSRRHHDLLTVRNICVTNRQMTTDIVRLWYNVITIHVFPQS